MVWKLVPGFSRYSVNDECFIYDGVEKRFIEPFIYGGGYAGIFLIDDFGNKTFKSRHQLVARAFLGEPPECNDSIMVVNHLNGIKGDDRPENLEWTTHRENVYHSGELGINPKCKPIYVKNIDTGEIKKYPAMEAYAREIGVSKDTILWRLKQEFGRVFPERRQYKFIHDERDFPDTNINHQFNPLTIKPVQSRNIFTKEIKEYQSLTEVAKKIDWAVPTVSMWMKKTKQPVTPNFLQLKWSSDPEWIDYQNPFLEMEKITIYKCIAVKEEKTGLITYYPSAIKCAKANNLLPTTLNWRLKRDGKIVYEDGKRYWYINKYDKSSGVVMRLEHPF